MNDSDPEVPGNANLILNASHNGAAKAEVVIRQSEPKDASTFTAVLIFGYSVAVEGAKGESVETALQHLLLATTALVDGALPRPSTGLYQAPLDTAAGPALLNVEMFKRDFCEKLKARGTIKLSGGHPEEEDSFIWPTNGRVVVGSLPSRSSRDEKRMSEMMKKRSVSSLRSFRS